MYYTGTYCSLFRTSVVQKNSSFIVFGVFFILVDVLRVELFCSVVVVDGGFST